MKKERLRWVGCVALLGAAMASAAAHAEESAASLPAVGDRVRLKLGAASLSGTAIEVEGDRLRLVLPRGGIKDVNLRAATDVSVARGKRRLAGEGALIGAGAVGGLFAVLFARCGECDGDTAAWALPYAAIGAGFGTLMGLAFTADRWEKVPGSRASFSIGPVQRGAQAGLTLRWGGRQR